MNNIKYKKLYGFVKKLPHRAFQRYPEREYLNRLIFLVIQKTDKMVSTATLSHSRQKQLKNGGGVP